MTQAVADILRQAAALTAEERAELADSLFDSIEAEPEASAEWKREIRRRVEETNAGHAESFTADEVLEGLRRRGKP